MLEGSAVEPLRQDLPEIVEVNALTESDKRLQRIGWGNEGNEVVHRRAVPQEGVKARSGKSAKPVTCPEALMAPPKPNKPPSVPRSSIVVPSHRKGSIFAVDHDGVARHLPRIVDGTTETKRAPQRAEVQHRRAVP